MKKLFIVASCAMYAMLAVSPALAISEAYRKQLEHEQKTQVQDTNPSGTENTVKTYSNKQLDVQVGSNCQVKTVNGFAPLKTTKLKKDTYKVTTRMGVTLSVLKKQDVCHITWSNDEGQSGTLQVKG